MTDYSDHEGYVCPGTNGDCIRNCCAFCNDSLFACMNCFGLDQGGSLTTDCAGRPLTADESNAVEDGQLDYRDGKWVKETSPFAKENQ